MCIVIQILSKIKQQESHARIPTQQIIFRTATYSSLYPPGTDQTPRQSMICITEL